MPEDDDAHLHFRTLADIRPDLASNTAKSFSTPAHIRCTEYRCLASYWFCALGYDYDTRLAATFITINNLLAYLTYIKRNFRDEDHISAAADSCFQRYPAYIATHHLADHNPMVAFGCGLLPIAGLCGCFG